MERRQPDEERLPAEGIRAGSAAPLPSDVASAGRRPKRLRGAKDDDSPQVQAQSGLHVDERRSRRRKTVAVFSVLVVVTLVSLFVKTAAPGFNDPIEVLACYGLWMHNLIAQMTGSSDVIGPYDLLARSGSYYEIVNRVPVTFLTLVCGGILAVSGTLYQSAFRNPIASPSMLGVSSAIQFGDVVLVLLYGVGAGAAEGPRYLICYGCIIVVMAVLFGCSRLMTGKGKPVNIVNLLLIATILNQIMGVLITYITLNYFTFDQWEVYSAVSEGGDVSLSAVSFIMLVITCVIGLVPVVLARFRLNALNFGDGEMKLLGVDANRLRIVAIVCGTVLLMGAQTEMGTVAMLALVVPHVSRMVFGAEFRKQFWGNVWLGAALLVLCRDIVGFIPYVGPMVPVSLVVNFVVLPFFVWMLATQQRGWEQ